MTRLAFGLLLISVVSFPAPRADASLRSRSTLRVMRPKSVTVTLVKTITRGVFGTSSRLDVEIMPLIGTVTRERVRQGKSVRSAGAVVQMTTHPTIVIDALPRLSFFIVDGGPVLQAGARLQLGYAESIEVLRTAALIRPEEAHLVRYPATYRPGVAENYYLGQGLQLVSDLRGTELERVLHPRETLRLDDVDGDALWLSFTSERFH